MYDEGVKPGRFSGVRWVFLDVGGVLVNEDRATAERLTSLGEALRAKGIMASRTAIHRAYHRAWMTGAARPFVEASSVLSGSPRTGYELWKALPYPDQHDRLVPGSVGVVRRLAAAGYRIGILANQSRSCRAKLRRWGVLRWTSVAVISAEVHMEKPDPRIFRLALRRAKCTPAAAVMIGDRIDNDIRPANRMGMRTIRVRTGWGRPQRVRSRLDRADATVGNLRGVLRPLGVRSR